QPGVDAGPAPVSLHEFPAKGIFALQVGTAGKKHPAAGGRTPLHAARIRTVGGDFAAVVKQHIRQETLIPLDQCACNQGRQTHYSSSSSSSSSRCSASSSKSWRNASTYRSTLPPCPDFLR